MGYQDTDPPPAVARHLTEIKQQLRDVERRADEREKRISTFHIEMVDTKLALAEFRTARKMATWLIGIFGSGIISLSAYVVSSTIRQEERERELRSRVTQSEETLQRLSDMSGDMRSLKSAMEAWQIAQQERVDQLRIELERTLRRRR